MWREGSYAISGGASRWPFDVGAWAVYHRADVAAATVFQLRIMPQTAGRTVALAVGTPDAVVARFTTGPEMPLTELGVYNVTLTTPLTVAGGDLFLLPDGTCVIDWFQLL